MGAYIKALSYYLPERVVTNEDLVGAHALAGLPVDMSLDTVVLGERAAAFDAIHRSDRIDELGVIGAIALVDVARVNRDEERVRWGDWPRCKLVDLEGRGL